MAILYILLAGGFFALTAALVGFSETLRGGGS